MELPYRSKAGLEEESYSEETEEKEDVSVDNRLYNGYQGSLMEPADISISPESSADAQNSSAFTSRLQLCVTVCYVVALRLLN